MLNNNKLSLLAVVLSTSFAILLTASPVVNAADNPFAASKLSNGFMIADNADGKCGEGKCGDKKKEDGKCGEGKRGDKKKEDGKCGDKKGAEGKCGS